MELFIINDENFPHISDKFFSESDEIFSDSDKTFF